MTVLSNPLFIQNPIEEVRVLLEKVPVVMNNALDVIEGREILGRQETYRLYGKVKGLASQLGGAPILLYLGHRILEIAVKTTVEEIKSESAAAISEEMVQFIQLGLSEALTTHSRSGSGLSDGHRHELLKVLLDGILYIKDRTTREKLFEGIACRLVENTSPDGKTVVDQVERVNFLRRHNMTNSWLLKEKGWT